MPIPTNFNHEITKMQYKLIWDKYLIRSQQLKNCKIDKERERLEDRWVIEDAADRVASAITNQSRPSRFLGIF